MERSNSDSDLTKPNDVLPEVWYTVEDASQAKLLTDPRSRCFFDPFLARELSVSAAAREVACSVDTMFYRVQKFLAAGLLVISRTEPRMGKPIKYYRSNADAYYIPFALTPFATLEEHLDEQMGDDQRALVHAMAVLLRQTGLEGRRLYRRLGGEVWSDAAADGRTLFSIDQEVYPVAYDFSIRLSLEQDDARQLQRELQRLYEYYSGRATESGKRYMLRVALMPVP